MGQKISPRALRLGYIQDWDSRWFSPREMPELIEEDYQIRRFLSDRYKLAALSRVVIERTGKYLRVNLHTARPGVVIGKRGADIEELRKVLQEMTRFEVAVNVIEVKRPELDAQLVSEAVAFQLEKQIAFRRAMKRAVERTMSAGAGGIKIKVSGRLGGNDIARSEWVMEGRVPLHTFRADIDYGFSEAHITMGRIGVKVWIFKKELFLKTEKDLIKEAEGKQVVPPEVVPPEVVPLEVVVEVKAGKVEPVVEPPIDTQIVGEVGPEETIDEEEVR